MQLASAGSVVLFCEVGPSAGTWLTGLESLSATLVNALGAERNNRALYELSTTLVIASVLSRRLGETWAPGWEGGGRFSSAGAVAGGLSHG